FPSHRCNCFARSWSACSSKKRRCRREGCQTCRLPRRGPCEAELPAFCPERPLWSPVAQEPPSGNRCVVYSSFRLSRNWLHPKHYGFFVSAALRVDSPALFGKSLHIHQNLITLAFR